MFPVPPSIPKGSNKGGGFSRIVKTNDNLRVQPQ